MLIFLLPSRPPPQAPFLKLSGRRPVWLHPHPPHMALMRRLVARSVSTIHLARCGGRGMVILTRHDVRRAAAMPAIMAAVAAGFVQLSGGQADVPLRPHIAIPEHEAT